MGILTEIRQNKKKKIWKAMFVILLLVIIIGGYLIFIKSNNQKSVIKTYTVSERDITSTLSADGKVRYKEQYDLNFPISGTLSAIYKNEGDIVKKGDVIAAIDDTYLKINLDKANIALLNANANLDSKLYSKSGDINISEKQLDSSKTSLESSISQGKIDLKNAQDSLISAKKDYTNALANLDTIKVQENLNVKNAYENAVFGIGVILPAFERYMKDIDMLLGITNLNKNVNLSIETYLGAKDNTLKPLAKNSFESSIHLLSVFTTKWEKSKNNASYDDINNYLNDIEAINESIYETTDYTLSTIKKSISSSIFPQSSIDTLISSFEANIAEIRSQSQKINSYRQNIEAAKTSLEIKVLNQENIIESLGIKVSFAEDNLNSVKTKLESNISIANSQIGISQANLDFKKSNFSPKELESFNIAIDNAKKGVEEAQKRIDDSKIRSPIDGKIGKLSVTKIGTILNANPTLPFVSVINKDSLYVEAKIEEGDIPNVYLGQEVKIGFNSLENVSLTGRVSFISDKSEADINNIITYKVDIIFDSLDKGVKEGFTAQLYFVLTKHRNIMAVPIETVKDENSKSFVTLKDGTKKEVKTGINDGDFVEIVSGLKKGDIINY
ncbi:MAG: HlyD family efflux transporter periplasmic adaptor subunit [Candidatus Gracilibacteria bacterium]|nr:HlyD family efflux transporter periplasmic adaptor subunit [Candidatus Gracilibacteria bacterium]